MQQSTFTVCLSLILFLGLSSCFSVKPSTTRTKTKAIESFYLGAEGNQYFIKPLDLVNAADELLRVDITIRYKDEGPPVPATLNFTVHDTPEPISPIALKLSNQAGEWTYENFQKIFLEKSEEGYHNRYSITAPHEDIKQFLTASTWEVQLETNQGSSTFSPTKKSQRAINEIMRYPFLP